MPRRLREFGDYLRPEPDSPVLAEWTGWRRPAPFTWTAGSGCLQETRGGGGPARQGLSVSRVSWGGGGGGMGARAGGRLLSLPCGGWTFLELGLEGAQGRGVLEVSRGVPSGRGSHWLLKAVLGSGFSLHSNLLPRAILLKTQPK